MEQAVPRERVGLDGLVLISIEDLPVEAGLLDGARERLQAIGVEHLVASLEGGVEPPVPANDRHQDLAHQVAAEHERVDAVEVRGREELPERDLRSVDVGREEEAVPLGPATRRPIPR